MPPSTFQETRGGNTSLKWSADGSLSKYDHQALMQRLCAVDPELAHSEACNDPSDGLLSADESALMGL